MHKYQIVFECQDGYKPIMTMEQLFSKKAFIAISDIDAPKGKTWSGIIKNDEEKSPEPFYLIYQDVSPENTEYKWPYNLIKIHFVQSDKYNSLLAPKMMKSDYRISTL